ncbi:MAG: hypothetical protein JRI59_10950 [Deltaproteobacteria bacterium]|nr:hypothetical protein [Deltaproteobacteria bacterium]
MERVSLSYLSRASQGSALIRLRGLYPSLKAALRKVADQILAHPEMAIYASVNEVAAAAGVSEATWGSGAFRTSKSPLPGRWSPPCSVCMKRWSQVILRKTSSARFFRPTSTPSRTPWRSWT